MKITDHGVFTPYVPSPERLRELGVEVAADPEAGTRGFMFTKSSSGEDFFDMEAGGAFAPGAMLVSVTDQNIVVSASFVGDRVLPAKDCRLLELAGDDVPDLPEKATRKMVDTAFGRLIDPPPPLRTFLYKTEIYERMSDAELEAFDAAMQVAPLRTRKMWGDCQHVEVASPLFDTLRHDMEEAFGKTRTDAILSLEEAQA